MTLKAVFKKISLIAIILCFAGSAHGMELPAKDIKWYSILGLPINKEATEEEINKAYRKLALKVHPDKGGTEEEFKKINEAKEALTSTKYKAKEHQERLAKQYQERLAREQKEYQEQVKRDQAKQKEFEAAEKIKCAEYEANIRNLETELNKEKGYFYFSEYNMGIKWENSKSEKLRKKKDFLKKKLNSARSEKPLKEKIEKLKKELKNEKCSDFFSNSDMGISFSDSNEVKLKKEKIFLKKKVAETKASRPLKEKIESLKREFDNEFLDYSASTYDMGIKYGESEPEKLLKEKTYLKQRLKVEKMRKKLEKLGGYSSHYHWSSSLEDLINEETKLQKKIEREQKKIEEWLVKKKLIIKGVVITAAAAAIIASGITYYIVMKKAFEKDLGLIISLNISEKEKDVLIAERSAFFQKLLPKWVKRIIGMRFEWADRDQV